MKRMGTLLTGGWMILAALPCRADEAADGERLEAWEDGGYSTRFTPLDQEAEKGDPQAQFLLAQMYAIGIGRLRDDARAAVWFEKAADQGFIEAQLRLGLMYVGGQGVPADPAAALMWFNLAAAQGGDKEKRVRDLMAESVSPQVIEKAAIMARERAARQANPD